MTPGLIWRGRGRGKILGLDRAEDRERSIKGLATSDYVRFRLLQMRVYFPMFFG